MRKNPWSECPFLWIALDSSVFSEIEIIKDASINAVSFSQFKYSWPGAVIFISWPVYFLVVMMTLDVRQCVDMCTMKHVFYQFCRLVYCLLFIYSILCCVANGPNFFCCGWIWYFICFTSSSAASPSPELLCFGWAANSRYTKQKWISEIIKYGIVGEMLTLTIFYILRFTF